jgi:hypothetical protein
MHRLIEKKITLIVVLVLFAAAFAWNVARNAEPTASSDALIEDLLAHGPSMPPDPWEYVAHGPSMPPDPWEYLAHGPSMPPDPWEYIVAHGNPNVILCERGIRTFETATRNTCDVAAVPVLNELTHLPVIVDPSHATGKRSLVPPLTRAAAAIGADGVIVEVHPQPEKAVSDGAQSLTLPQFRKMMSDLQPYIQLWKAQRSNSTAKVSA